MKNKKIDKKKNKGSKGKKIMCALGVSAVLVVACGAVVYKNLDVVEDKVGLDINGLLEKVSAPDKVIAIKSNTIQDIYLAIGGTKTLDVSVATVGNPKYDLVWESSDTNVVTIEGNVITGVGNGSAKVTVKADNQSYTYNVLVTDLIQVPTYNNDKPYLPCGRYTEEEAALLDKILESRVNEAGYGTRGGVVAAARFITLEFPYLIKYFNENGRLVGNGIDGEGRFYHKGMYLSESKFSEITKSTSSGPATWGCTLYDAFLSSYRPNGFTCSGFATWAFLQGGLDTGDVGAGDYSYLDNELSDMGPHQQITYDFMKNGQYKVGDFIARDGHAAIIIGISDTTIYTAESLPPRLKVYEYERYRGIVEDPNLTYIINMDTIYPNGEGKYTDMW